MGAGFPEDAAGPRMGILEERCRVALETQRLLPTERDRLLGLHADHVVSDRRHADRFGNLAFLRLRQILAALRDLRVRAVDRFVDQVVEVDDASFARRHPAFRQVDERIEDRLRRPVDAHQLEGGLQPLERELVVLSDDVDRDVAPTHLVQVVRDVPGRVQGRSVASYEDVFRGVPFEAERGQVEVVGAAFLLAEGYETLDDPLDTPVEDRVALPEERVVGDIHAAQRFQDAAEDGLADLPDVFRELDVAALEALCEPLDVVLQRLVAFQHGARLLIELHVAVFDPPFRIRRVGRQVVHGPVQQDHLAPDVVHQVFARDRIPGDPKQTDERVPEERIAGPADVQRPGGVRARVLEQDPLLPCGRSAIRLAIGPDGGEDQLREGRRVHGEVHVRTLVPQRGERSDRLHARRPGGDGGRGLFQLLRPRVGREGEQAAVGGSLLKDSRGRHVEFGLDRAPDPLRAEPEPRLPETLGDEERFDGAELKRVSDLLLPIRRQAAVLLADLLHEPLHKRFLAHQVEAAQDLPRLLDELSQAVLVRVTGVEERGQDLFLQLVMEIIAGREFFLRVARTADDDPFQVRKVQERLGHQVADLLVPLMDRDVVASLEPSGTLTPHPVLRRHLGLEILDDLDPFASQEAEGRLAPVDHDEAVDVLLREHLVERRRVEFRVAPIEERRDRLRRFQDERDHFRLVRPDLLVAGEDDQPIGRRHPVRPQPLDRGLDRLRHVLSSARALDVRRLRQLGTQVVRDVPTRVNLFIVTGGGRIARYYIETGRELGIGERTLDEFGIAVTRLNARLLAAALNGRANREPAKTYAEAAALGRRHAIVIMAGTRPRPPTDRAEAPPAPVVPPPRVVDAAPPARGDPTDPRKDPPAPGL